MQIIPCRCPECGQDLQGLDNDRVFICKSCALAVHFKENGTVQNHPVKFVKSLENESNRIIYLPFWLYRVDVNLSCKDDKKLRKAQRFTPQNVFLNAFKMHGFSLYGNPGLSFTAHEPSLVWDNREHFMVGCRRTAESARESLNHVTLSVIDKHEDVTGLEIELIVRDTLLIGIPFLDQGEKIRDAIMGKDYLALAFDDLNLAKSLKEKTAGM